MLTIKLSDEQLTALGISTQAEAIAALENIAAAKTENESLQTKLAAKTVELEGIEARLSAVEKKSAAFTLDSSAVLIQAGEIAKAAATRIMTESMAKLAIKPIEGGRIEGGEEAAKETTFEQEVAALVKGGTKTGAAVRQVAIAHPDKHQSFIERGGKL